MSLLGFQRALADLAASPGFCTKTIQSPEATLHPYELTDQERARLAAMVRDPLMATNCALYRANRMTPIFMFFPMTCRLLGQTLRLELDAFWSAQRAVDLQYLQETDRFARFVRERTRLGLLNNHYLEEIVDYETAAMELRFANRAVEPLMRFVHFSHDPSRLLGLLEESGPIPEDLPQGDYCVLLEARGGILEVRLAAHKTFGLSKGPS